MQGAINKKAILIAVRALLTAGIAAAGIYIIYAYEYLENLASLDNIVGVIPVAFVILCSGGLIALVWMKYSKKSAAIAISTAAVVVLSAALFPTALRGNWWIAKPDTSSGSDGDISGYAPFIEGSLAAELGEDSELVMDSDLPVMDGALALYPVYSAVAQAVYKQSAYDGEVKFTNTVKAFEAVIAGERDIIFSAAASKKQLAAAERAGVELVLTPIGKEAFVFVVGKNNPVGDISYQQIKNIYSGKTAYWRTLGWKEGGKIIAFQRPEGSGSQTGLQGIMKGLPIQAPQPLPSAELIGTNSLMQQISVELNGVGPTVENIQCGKYPFTVNFYAVTRGEPAGNAKRVIEWILSPQGQRLIKKTGYIPL